MHTLIHDIRYATRTALRDRGFSTVAILTLALGIGANTALFTIVHAVVLAPLPFDHPDRLVRVTVDFTGQGARDVGLSMPEVFDLRDRSGLFEQVAGVWPISANLTETDEPERVETALVDANYFTMLGVGASLGRVFTTHDAQPGIAEVAVISDGLWKRRFGGSRDVLGRRIRIDNDLYSIIGVAPPTFHHPGRTLNGEVDIWAPAGWLASPFPNPPIRRAYQLQGAIARLKPGASLIDAQARLDAFSATLRQTYPKEYPPGSGWQLRLIPLHEDVVGQVRPALLTLLASVGFVLLIACANVANLLLARSSVRERELAIRRALGAGRGRLIRQLLTESFLLAAAGAGAGLLLAVWATDALVRIIPTALPHVRDVSVNPTVLLFTASLAVLTGILFGVAPAMQAANVDVHPVLAASSRSMTSGRTGRLRALFVVAECALALVLLVGAALVIQSFWRAQHVPLGFDPESVLTARIWLPQPNDPKTGPYFTHTARQLFYRRVLDRVGALPGVTSVGGVVGLPLADGPRRFSFTIEGRRLESDDTPTADGAIASTDYFRTLRIPLRQGRLFTAHDDDKSPGVVIVNDAFVRRFFPNENPIGRRIGLRPPALAQSTPPAWLTVVGIVGDVRVRAVERDPEPIVYRSVDQVSSLALTLVVRAEGDAAGLGESIRREVRAVDPDEPLYGVRPMDDIVADALATRRFTMLLLGFFAATALALAAIGIYGVMAYLVAQRTHEIGIRIALGAGRGDVVRLVVGQGVRLAILGVLVGTMGALGLTQLISALLFHVSARDPLTFGGLAVTLAIVAGVASYLPARRATRVAPIQALRCE